MLAKYMLFGKQKFDVKLLKMSIFIFNVKQKCSTVYFSFLVGYGKDSERNQGFRLFRETFIQRAGN